MDDIKHINNYKDRISNAWDTRELLGIKDEILKDTTLTWHFKNALIDSAQRKIDYMEV